MSEDFSPDDDKDFGTVRRTKKGMHWRSAVELDLEIKRQMLRNAQAHMQVTYRNRLGDLPPDTRDSEEISRMSQKLGDIINVLGHGKSAWTEEEIAKWQASTHYLEAVQEAYSSIVAGPKIEIAPGFGTMNFLGHFCQKNFRERVLEALHAEATEDYFESLKRGDKTRANHIKRMMHVWMVVSMLRGVVGWVFGKLSFKIGTGD